MNQPLLHHYQTRIQESGFVADPVQEQAINALDRIAQQLTAQHTKKRGLFSRGGRQPIEGLYLWGSVGRGKTWIMDMFYQALPSEQAKRRHFHRFMGEVHTALNGKRKRQNPLEAVAEDIAKDTRLICFDEFFVSDITDAMILGTLFSALFRRGVTLVATSNIPPDNLYADGLQRARFLPAIELLKQHCQVMNVDGGVDYRLRQLQQADVFYSPADMASEQALAKRFDDLNNDQSYTENDLIINERNIPTKRYAEGLAWFEFNALCAGPRSQADYIELAKQFHTVLISHIPILDSSLENEARRFISLIDELYDHNINLLFSAQKPLTELYCGQKLSFEFKRTLSRLTEMRSTEYLARPHVP